MAFLYNQWTFYMPKMCRLSVRMLVGTAVLSWLLLVTISLSLSGWRFTAVGESHPYQHQLQDLRQVKEPKYLSSQQLPYTPISESQHQEPHNSHLRVQPQPQQLHMSSILLQQPHMSLSETLHYQKRCWHANYSISGKSPLDHTPLPFLLGQSESSGHSCRGEIFLLIMVHSAVANSDRRELIRRTWASISNVGGDRLATVFFVGRSNSPIENSALKIESDTRADIVQGDFVDSYRNLTYKHLHALKWIGERCRSVRYVMKVDDDVVLNVFQLRVALKERFATANGDFFYCQVNRIKPLRTLSSKWRVTTVEWPDDMYPDYCKGFGYVMTGSLIVPLHHCAKWRRYFWIDDVFVSGALASALGARRIQWEDGWNAKDMHPRLVGPEAGQLVIVNEAGNWVTPSLHRRVWRAMMRYSGGLDEI